jgi:hypothetical protein
MSEIERLIDMLGCGNTTPQERYQWAHKLVDLSHAEGVAEGAEKEREKIRTAARYFQNGEYMNPNDRFYTDIHSRVYSGARQCVVPASVLAPTKEKP